MFASSVKSDRKLLSDRRDTSRPQESRDWIADQAKALSAKEGAELTELSPRGFQAIRAGDSKPSFDALMAWCRNDKSFAVMLAIHIGVILPGDAEAVEAMMRAMHAFVRRAP